MRLAKKWILPILALALLATGLSACRKDDTPGESLDRALDRTGDAVKDAGEAIKPGK